MEAKELMVSDLVVNTEFGRKQIGRIECIEPTRVWLQGGKSYTPISYIEPIPLTQEILEKNGFERSEVFVEWKYENDNVYMIYKPFPYLKIQMEECIVAFPCEYIHQLQHALRLCGIEKTIEL